MKHELGSDGPKKHEPADVAHVSEDEPAVKENENIVVQEEKKEILFFDLQRVISVFAVISAVSYAMGWLKVKNYYRILGLDLALLELPLQSYLFESWFSVKNYLFFLLFWWITVRSKSLTMWFLAAIYSVLPFFLYHCNAMCVKVSSTLFYQDWALLHLAPIVVVLLLYLSMYHLQKHPVQAGIRHFTGDLSLFLKYVWLLWEADPGSRFTSEKRSSYWPYGREILVFFFFLVTLWSLISTQILAKIHAIRALRFPEHHFSKIKEIYVYDTSGKGKKTKGKGCVPLRYDSESNHRYLVHSSAKNYFIWDRKGFEYPPDMNQCYLSSSEWMLRFFPAKKGKRKYQKKEPAAMKKHQEKASTVTKKEPKPTTQMIVLPISTVCKIKKERLVYVSY